MSQESQDLLEEIVKQLLEQDLFFVRGRNPLDTDKTLHLTSLPNSKNLEIVKAALSDLESCKKACEGAKFLIHAASPFAFGVKDPQADLVDPAVQGTRNFLLSAKHAGISKVVVQAQSQQS